MSIKIHPYLNDLNIDQNNQFDAILLEFSETFDKLGLPDLFYTNSTAMEYKLTSWGMDHGLHVTTNKGGYHRLSQIFHTTSGVPQGTVLGTKLFRNTAQPAFLLMTTSCIAS